MGTATLDWREKQQVQYAIPLWLRDQQVRANVLRVKGRIQPGEKRDEPVALVGFGPSLQETWEQVRGFRWVISCSGSHKFLLERGITATWHVDVDPRPHKVELLGPPHPEVLYLPSSTVHPAYLDHLERGLGRDLFDRHVALWHVFDASEDGLRLLPRGEWSIAGGCDVGLRTMTVAAFLGFTDLHIFGLDGCARGEARHAAAHPHGKQPYAEVEYNGVRYLTTPAMLEAARGVLHELDQMPSARATFYGDGLVQAMMKDWTPKAHAAPKALMNVVGFQKPELISAECRELNARLHRENAFYGISAEKHVATVLKLAESLKTKNILDFGCGKGLLGRAIPWQIAEYDPCIPGKDEAPKPADLVCCIDVLEHVEPEKLPFVLDELRRCVRQVGYFTIHTGPAQKCYADGRNTHLIQRDRRWWEMRLAKFFAIGRIFEVGPELYMVVGPKQRRVAPPAHVAEPAPEKAGAGVPA